MNIDAVPVRDAAGLAGYLAARDNRCEALLPTGLSLGLYNTVAAAMNALQAARAGEIATAKPIDL